MEDEKKYLTLNEVGDLIFSHIQNYLFRDKKDRGIEIFVHQGSLQELFTLSMRDGTRILVKIYPHKNYIGNLVYRLEVYKIKKDDLRGNKVEFIEANSETLTNDEIYGFVTTFLAKIDF